MVDGFTIDGPDTAENQQKYPQNPAQEEGLDFPILRCVCLISMITGMLIDLGYAAYSGKGTGKTAILRQLRSSPRAGDIVVADSNHCTYWFIAICLKIGVLVVMKNHHKRDDDPIGAKHTVIPNARSGGLVLSDHSGCQKKSTEEFLNSSKYD